LRRANPIIVDVWPSVPEAVNLNDGYWIHDEHTYHESNIELRQLGFIPIVCTVSLGERNSLKRDGLTYEFFPIDDPLEAYREQTSSGLCDFLHQLEPDIIVIHLLNRKITNVLLEDPHLKAIRILQINTYHTKGITFDCISKNPDCVDVYFVNSPSLKVTLQDCHLVPESKIRVLPSAVDSGVFFCDKKARKKWDLVWAGQLRMDDDKRAEVFITLIKKMGCNMLIVGDGPKRAILEKMARDEGVEDLVNFYGWVPYREFPALLNQASVYVTAALLDPSSRSLTEALSCGLPAVGFVDCLGVEGQILDGFNGFLVKDVDEMASSLKFLLTQKNRYNRMSENSRRIAKQRFGKKLRVKTMVLTFHELLREQHYGR
jgi:glycosyltransferase involved in cell wall biosynthesis